jgi:uncharacterized membrane protein YeaQ/YmgE (transglycosylase-associated protein family)
MRRSNDAMVGRSHSSSDTPWVNYRRRPSTGSGRNVTVPVPIANVVAMSIVGWIVVGLIAGGIARWIVKDDRSGCMYTMIVGVLGALIGGWLMSTIDSEGVDEFSIRSIGVAAIGAVLLLLVLQAIAGRGATRRR